MNLFYYYLCGVCDKEYEGKEKSLECPRCNVVNQGFSECMYWREEGARPCGKCDTCEDYNHYLIDNEQKDNV